jgi:hypothetical protein
MQRIAVSFPGRQFRAGREILPCARIFCDAHAHTQTAPRLRPLVFAGALLTFALAPFRAPAQEGAGEPKRFDEVYQFIFFATLEGLYRDGVSTGDIDSLLAREGFNGGYLNFIYTCPVCTPVECAIATYDKRPKIDRYKVENYQTTERTFGFGLPKETSEALRSKTASVRLGAVNELVSKWLSYRMEHSGFTDDQKKGLVEKLKKAREEGMRALQGFAKNANGPESMKHFAAGYEGGDECAICNAALQMPLKLQAPAK